MSTLPIINTSLLSWVSAKKTKGIKTKNLKDVLNVPDILLAKFTINTLEGPQIVKNDSGDAMVCRGIEEDVWLQPKTKLLAKYNIVNIDTDGWFDCYPKDNVTVNCC